MKFGSICLGHHLNSLNKKDEGREQEIKRSEFSRM